MFNVSLCWRHTAPFITIIFSRLTLHFDCNTLFIYTSISRKQLPLSLHCSLCDTSFCDFVFHCEFWWHKGCRRVSNAEFRLLRFCFGRHLKVNVCLHLKEKRWGQCKTQHDSAKFFKRRLWLIFLHEDKKPSRTQTVCDSWWLSCLFFSNTNMNNFAHGLFFLSYFRICHQSWTDGKGLEQEWFHLISLTNLSKASPLAPPGGTVRRGVCSCHNEVSALKSDLQLVKCWRVSVLLKDALTGQSSVDWSHKFSLVLPHSCKKRIRNLVHFTLQSLLFICY